VHKQQEVIITQTNIKEHRITRNNIKQYEKLTIVNGLGELIGMRPFYGKSEMSTKKYPAIR